MSKFFFIPNVVKSVIFKIPPTHCNGGLEEFKKNRLNSFGLILTLVIASFGFLARYLEPLARLGIFQIYCVPFILFIALILLSRFVNFSRSYKLFLVIFVAIVTLNVAYSSMNCTKQICFALKNQSVYKSKEESIAGYISDIIRKIESINLFTANKNFLTFSSKEGVLLKSFTRSKQARRWLSKNKNCKLLFWWDKNNLIVEVQDSETPVKPLLLKNSPLNLDLITNVPRFTMTFDSGGYSYRFLKIFLEENTKIDSDKLSDERNLSLMAAVRGGWSGTSHLAYANLKLGDFLYYKAFSGKTVNLLLLRCALKNYSKAWQFIGRDRKSSLYVAIANNYIVTKATLSFLSAKPKQFKKSLDSINKLKQLLGSDLKKSLRLTT